ncbi:cilia- and flagella-associated protein 68 [Pituophis catenifer annectens]|uniref:cilia- and flagella-associated protein 68 n=1 Tax=Pituophis catenifer annectens TaxID=94852 RepID=UPI00399105E3
MWSLDESSSSNITTTTSNSEPLACFPVSIQDMSLSCFFNPLHGCLLHADGHGEVWTDWNSTSKFFQYGWRCTTNEDMYANKTLLGNWNEERYDIQKRRQLKPLPSQYAHYFEATYASDYSKEKPRRLRRVTREPHWFPGHQPELEPPPIKPTARSCYMIDYEPPHGRPTCSLVEVKPKEATETPPKQ